MITSRIFRRDFLGSLAAGVFGSAAAGAQTSQANPGPGVHPEPKPSGLSLPLTFQKSLKHTIEHGHANDRGDCFYSVGYWYQSEPFTDFPALPGVEERIPGEKHAS